MLGSGVLRNARKKIIKKISELFALTGGYIIVIDYFETMLPSSKSIRHFEASILSLITWP